MIEMRYAKAEDVNSLKKLFLSCFDEKPEAVDLFFEKLFEPENCFAAFDSGELLAMLFLLPCSVNGQSARYLYAAATKKEFRGMGIMDGLVKAALSVVAPEICVTLPAEDSLYDYYKRFGFKELSVNVAEVSRDELQKLAKPIEDEELVVENYCGIRSRVLKNNFLFWNNKHINFAFEYNTLYGAKIIRTNYGYAVAFDEDGVCEVTELICDDKNAPLIFSRLLKEFEDCGRFRFRLSPNQKCLKSRPEKFGMARRAAGNEPVLVYAGLTLE